MLPGPGWTKRTAGLEFLRNMSEMVEEARRLRVERGVLHEIRVTPHWIPPWRKAPAGGWMYVWRTDGERTLYISHELWAWIPKQNYGGIKMVELPDEHARLGYRLTAIPTYVEAGCPD